MGDYYIHALSESVRIFMIEEKYWEDLQAR